MVVGIGSVEKQGMVVPMEHDHAYYSTNDHGSYLAPMGRRPPRQRGAISVRELSDSGKKGAERAPFLVFEGLHKGDSYEKQ